MEEDESTKINVMEKMIEEEESKPISKKIEDIIIKEVEEQTDIRCAEHINEEEERKRSKMERLSEATNTLKKMIGCLERDIQNLIYEFEDASNLKIKNIDIVTNPDTQDYGFNEQPTIKRPILFGFSDEVKSKRNHIIRITLSGL